MPSFAQYDFGYSDQKIAVITGGTRGNGFAIAHELGCAGMHVILLDIEHTPPNLPYTLAEPGEGSNAAQALCEQGLSAEWMACDVRYSAQVEHTFESILSQHQRIDVLVNNAGLVLLKPLTETRDEDWMLQLNTMASGTFYCCRAALPPMNAKGYGRIINIASVAGIRGLGHAAAYSAAKHAVVGLTKSLAMEVAKQGITVNAICPGTVDTPLVRGTGKAMGWDEQTTLEHFSGRHLTNSPLMPQDIAAAVGWLASNAAARITGTIVPVDDGWHSS